MTRHEVTIPGWRPRLLNELKGHPLKAARLKAADAFRLGEELALAGVPRVDVPPLERQVRLRLGLPRTLPDDPTPVVRRVAIRIVGPFRGGLPDPDAPLKSTLDALVKTGHLVDDGEAWCEWSTPEFARAKALATTLVLEDIP